MQEFPVVHLRQCKVYDHDFLLDFFQSCFEQEDICSLRGTKVLIKPNLISAKGDGLACTHPQFMLTLAEWLQQAGAHVAVGDSPAFGKATGILRALKVKRKLEKRGIQIVDFKTTVNKTLNCGVEVGLASEALECDLLVNAPKLKAHNQMYVTIAVKNFFGIVRGMRKAILHMRYGDRQNMFSRIIMDLLEFLPPHVSVVDGIDAMHIEGPVSGAKINLGCLAISRDPVAIDTSLLHALELVPSNSPLWSEARRRKMVGSDLANIRFPGSTPEVFKGAGFKVPEELAPQRFSPFRFVKSNMKRLWLNCVSQ